MNAALTRLRRIAAKIRRRLLSEVPAKLDPFAHQPPLQLPEGFTRERILKVFHSVCYDGRHSPELHGYASGDFERFLHTLALVPDGRGRMLEIGANPYFTTLLLRRFRSGYELDTTNYFRGPPGLCRQHIAFDGFDGTPEAFDVEYHSVNIEEWKLPLDDASMDVVVFGEVLEHMTNDPMFALCEIARVLKTGGVLVLTTPNVARLGNVVALIEGHNLYDPYSGYGPYGRHNREYTRHELHLLLVHCGFEVEISYTANVHPDREFDTVDWTALQALMAAVPHRQRDLGQYLFTRWRKVADGDPRRPAWLYRSYPAENLA